MKKVIKNYLAKLQENDKKGFSLVELIIVMAIMAILVGVVASQVLPYMDKSRQSKDQQILSSMCTDMVSATAQSGQDLGNTDVTASMTDASKWPSDTAWQTVLTTYEELQGTTGLTAYGDLGLKSKEASKANMDVEFKYTAKTGAIEIYLTGHQGDTTTKYTVSSSTK